MEKKKGGLVGALVAGVFVVGIILIGKGSWGTGSIVDPLDDSGWTLGDLENVVEANNQFALDLYKQYEEDEGNIFFSPYSITTALAMTYEGARGETATEMQSVFYFPENDTERQASYAKMYNDINAKGKEYQLSTANALWAEQSFSFLDEYFASVDKYYGGEVTNLDFVSEAEKSRVTINDWVEDETNDKIKDLIPTGVITADTRLVLTNAIYFKGDWVKQFDEAETRDADFKVSFIEDVTAQMMQSTGDESEFKYAEIDEDNVQILEMPYSGDDLSMLVLLPREDDIEDLENILTSEKLSEWQDSLADQRVDVYLPKFKFETKYMMAETLSTMGMPSAFSGSADFSGMTGQKDLFISQVIHQAFVEVNEEGTEAAAATAVVMKELSMAPGENPISVFRADHPFIFIIQQEETGNILFMGRVSDPTN